ncbi:Scr1 family TA system antitoxin-like transcriptional regulator [Streptomyces sp. NPDC086122]|uniref:Scr1 family TA system antitoxin-like transcriptional regulator n=1 Tax=Streptomyces sp. NPDC086122 TaxID=3155294 RepID=UPI00343EF2F8
MPASPSSRAQDAREALAARLAHLIRDAGINGRELSRRCHWDPAKTSRILRARTAPSDTDIRIWCAACGADDQAADLVATNRAVDSMYLEWRRQHQAGMRRTQEDVLARNAAAHMCRAYVSNVIPGFFQTADYATALMRSITDFQGTPDDITEAVAARLARSRFLYEGGHRFVVLIEEWVLHTRIGPPGDDGRPTHTPPNSGLIRFLDRHNEDQDDLADERAGSAGHPHDTTPAARPR